ncbi:MAG TPA: autotransporter-associated beta strand repeat-containing protein [Tepidisphaeraceae bacterium]|nr:autotransporter-associated beta strand repeat-containing protein [Tepidisphaeraceae bacterium]
MAISQSTGGYHRVNGVISGAAGFGKGAQGTMVLNGNNLYTGPTTIANGTLAINGSNVSDTLVGAGKLQGVGSVRILSVYDDASNANPAGALSPGDDTAAATFTASRADFADGGSYLFNLNDAATGAGIGWGLLSLNGAGTANGNLDVPAGAGGFTINLTGAGAGFDDGIDQVFTMVDAAAVTGFDPSDFVIDTSGFAPTYGGTFSVSDAGGNLNLVYTAVPEPAVASLMGIAGLVLLTRRRRA